MKGKVCKLNRPGNFLNDSKKYFDYFFETRGFISNSQITCTDQAILAAKLARGVDRGPVIFIHGIMPRSGTVYVGELLRRHPDLHAYPHQLWEFPALQLAGEIPDLQKKFFLGYKLNKNKLGENDFLPLFGASLIAYLHESTPPHQRVLVKMPSVQYLDRFFSMFPHENLLILLRDGRDLVHSTLRTWPHLNFVQVCLRWNRSARMVLSTLAQLNSSKRKGFWLAKYENVLSEPENFIKQACRSLCLDENRYPFELIQEIRVIGSSKLENRDKVTWRHLKKPKDFKPVEYWRKWPTTRKLIYKVIAGKSTIELGYCKDLRW
jgi:protein-tyrosine sulfotransferase